MIPTPLRYEGRNADRQIEDWVTVAVTALPPGWRNQYKHPDGSIEADDCSGLLLQELRMITYCWTVEPPIYEHTEDVAQSMPYQTRVVFAEHNDSGVLDVAENTGNYVGTLGPGAATDDGPDITPQPGSS